MFPREEEASERRLDGALEEASSNHATIVAGAVARPSLHDIGEIDVLGAGDRPGDVDHERTLEAAPSLDDTIREEDFKVAIRKQHGSSIALLPVAERRRVTSNLGGRLRTGPASTRRHTTSRIW
jgi:hypothetical protein